jgi:hypothetical protein
MASGAEPRDLTEIVRVMQYMTLFTVCYLIDDPDLALEGLKEVPEEIRAVNWGLFEVYAQGELGRRIPALHESLLETDPTGREMRPDGPKRGPT